MKWKKIESLQKFKIRGKHFTKGPKKAPERKIHFTKIIGKYGDKDGKGSVNIMCGPGRNESRGLKKADKAWKKIKKRMKERMKCSMITAHSGCDGTPENSLEFLRTALLSEADAVEVDVRKNGEGKLILSHDETEEDAVTLEEAFRMAEGIPKKKINCDLKQKGLEEEIYRLALEYGMESRLIFTGDVNPQLFRKESRAFPSVVWYANLEVFLPDAFRLLNSEERLNKAGELLLEVLCEMEAYAAAGINWHYSLAEQVLKQAKEKGIGVSVWTVDEEELMRKFLREHVDNITTKRLKRLITIRDEERL